MKHKVYNTMDLQKIAREFIETLDERERKALAYLLENTNLIPTYIHLVPMHYQEEFNKELRLLLS